MNGTEASYLITIPASEERDHAIFKYTIVSNSLMISQIAMTALAAGLFLGSIDDQKNPDMIKFYAIVVISGLGGCGLPYAVCSAVSRKLYLLNQQLSIQKQGFSAALETLTKHRILNTSIGQSFLITQLGCAAMTMSVLGLVWSNWEGDYVPIGIPSLPMGLSIFINAIIILKLSINLQNGESF